MLKGLTTGVGKMEASKEKGTPQVGSLFHVPHKNLSKGLGLECRGGISGAKDLSVGPPRGVSVACDGR